MKWRFSGGILALRSVSCQRQPTTIAVMNLAFSAPISPRFKGISRTFRFVKSSISEKLVWLCPKIARSSGRRRIWRILFKTGEISKFRSLWLIVSKLCQKFCRNGSEIPLTIFCRKVLLVKSGTNITKLASSHFAKVRKLWLSTSSVRIPKWSGNSSLKTVRSISATNSSLTPNLVSSNGLIPTILSFALGSSRTKSSSRSFGNLSKTSRIKSPFGSITTAECPFLTTCKIKLSITVDLPAPVPPNRWRWLSRSSGRIFKGILFAPKLSAKQKPFWCFIPIGGKIVLGANDGTPASSFSPAGSRKRLASSLAESMVGKCQGTLRR